MQTMKEIGLGLMVHRSILHFSITGDPSKVNQTITMEMRIVLKLHLMEDGMTTIAMFSLVSFVKEE